MAGTSFSVRIRMPASRRLSRRLPIVLPSNRISTTQKTVWGSGQQEVRNIWNNLAVYNLNIRWLNSGRWDKRHEELCDRSDSPWDDTERRPSHSQPPQSPA